MSNAAERPRAFYGRRKGRPLRRRRADLLETLLPRLALPLHRRPPNPLGALFTPPVQSVFLEIGFGAGEHLEAQLANVRLHFGDAADVIAWIPDAALARVDLLYPDPWPKRRHWKRRFVQDESVAALARVLATGGEFRFATDSPDYAAWTLERLLRSRRFTWTAERAGDWRLPWQGYVRTRYEEKAIRDGRRPCYLVFRRTG